MCGYKRRCSRKPHCSTRTIGPSDPPQSTGIRAMMPSTISRLIFFVVALASIGLGCVRDEDFIIDCSKGLIHCVIARLVTRCQIQSIRRFHC